MIEQIRLIHKAFEKEPNHIATYVPSQNLTVDENLEQLYSRTQNIEESWIKDKSNFSVIPTTDQRSTMVGDLMVVCYDNPKGNGSKEVWYQVDDVGFKKYYEKGAA
tara:strand:+ start:360 stop:677 length:318 start_codon:yes stop_codon:yes gene_type:complete